jgi:hypothetical protein
MGLGNQNPYAWMPSGNHIILVTGVTSDGNILTRDPANCTDLYDPNSLRPGPRKYQARTLHLISATVVAPPWRPRPMSTTPPGGDMQIPDGWTDDGSTLTAPNGEKVVLGFRNYILRHLWDPTDVPLAPEASVNPVELGYQQSDGHNAGMRQIFMYSELCYTTSRGIYRASVGREFWTLLHQHAVTQPASQLSMSGNSATVAGGGELQSAVSSPPLSDAAAAIPQDLVTAVQMIRATSAYMMVRLGMLQQVE